MYIYIYTYVYTIYKIFSLFSTFVSVPLRCGKTLPDFRMFQACMDLIGAKKRNGKTLASELEVLQ